jgi:hypothetical protein
MITHLANDIRFESLHQIMVKLRLGKIGRVDALLCAGLGQWSGQGLATRGLRV